MRLADEVAACDTGLGPRPPFSGRPPVEEDPPAGSPKNIGSRYFGRSAGGTQSPTTTRFGSSRRDEVVHEHANLIV